MQPHEYSFDAQLKMSSGFAECADVVEILLANIPGSVSVVPASTVNDKQGVDWWVEMSTARHLAVDAKVRAVDWAKYHPSEDDVALESWSVVESGVVGWTRDEGKRCDYILWLWKDTGRFCLVPFPMLCAVFKDNWQGWRGAYKTSRQITTHKGGIYHSECIFVPRRELWAEMYRRFGGNGKLGIRGAA